MKTSNFISQFKKSIRINSYKVWQTFMVGVALLLGLSPLIVQNPASYWYLPMIGVLLFTHSLTGMNIWKKWLPKATSDQTETEDLEHIEPVMETLFAKQNSAANHSDQKAA